MSKKILKWQGAALGCISVLSLSSALFAQGGFDGPGRYEIMNLQSGRVIDLDRNDQSTVIQFSTRGTDNQAWDVQRADGGYFYLRNAMNGYALEASSDRNSAPLRGAPFNGSPSQQWRIDPGKDGNAIMFNRNGKVIDVPDGTKREGERLQTYGLTGDANQRFIFRRMGGGITGRNVGGRPSSRDYDRGRGPRDSAFGGNAQPDQRGRYFDDRDRMYKINGDGVCFYRERNYRGEAFCAHSGEDIRDVGPSWRDSFASVKFFGRTRGVDVYENENYRGARIRIDNDEPDLGRLRGGRGSSSNVRAMSFRTN